MSIEGIFRSKVASGKMQSIEIGVLISGQGLEGDRYCAQAGTYSVFRASKLNPGEPEPGRQLTLMSADSVELALEKLEKKPESLGDLRRNIVIRGISSQQLLDAIGHIILLGDTCRVLVHRNCVPCMYNERKNELPGFMEGLWDVAGVSCEVLVGGTISCGDPVTILTDKGAVDGGNQAPGFYIPPSKRTSEMVKEGIARKRAAKARLLESDPEGVKRLDASFEKVGLVFWPKDKV